MTGNINIEIYPFKKYRVDNKNNDFHNKNNDLSQ